MIITANPPFAGTQIGDKTVMANQMPGLTTEARINAAITRAVAIGALYVYIPANMLPYNPSLVTFNNAVQMIREGGDTNVFDVQAYGAQATLASDQTVGLQAAIDAQHGAARGRVWIPGGSYLFSGLHFYSGSFVEGEGFVGPLNAPGAILVQTTAAAIMLQPATPTSLTPTSGFTLRGFAISSFANANNLGGLDCTNCTDYTVEDVLVNGCAVFGVRAVGGTVPGNAGFAHFTRVIVNGHQAGAYAWVISSSANADQPDGLTFTDCRTSSSTGTWIHYVCVGGNHGPGSNVWKGCTFEAQGGTAAVDMTVDAAGAGPNLFVGCRFENTGTGGIQVTLNGFGIQPFGWFVGCDWAPGVGGFTFVDNGPVKSTRFAELNGATSSLLFQILGLQTALRTVTVTGNILQNDHTILADATAGNIILSLPNPSASIGNQVYKIKKIDSSANTVTINAGANTLDGLTTLVLNQQYQSVDIQSDGTNWWIIATQGISAKTGNSFTIPLGSKYATAGAEDYIQMSAGTFTLGMNSSNQYIMDSSTFRPSTAAGKGIGTTALPFANLVLAVSNLGSGTAFAPNCAVATTFIATANGAFTWNAPTSPLTGQRITLTVIQDGTGGRTVAFNAVFKVTWSDAGNAAGKRSSISAIYDGTNWNQDGAQTPYV